LKTTIKSWKRSRREKRKKPRKSMLRLHTKIGSKGRKRRPFTKIRWKKWRGEGRRWKSRRLEWQEDKWSWR